jgi:hypothetical protein
MIPSGIVSMTARRRAWYSVESMDVWEKAFDRSKSGIRKRHMERTLAHVSVPSKAFSDQTDESPDEPEHLRCELSKRI